MDCGDPMGRLQHSSASSRNMQGLAKLRGASRNLAGLPRRLVGPCEASRGHHEAPRSLAKPRGASRGLAKHRGTLAKLREASQRLAGPRSLMGSREASRNTQGCSKKLPATFLGEGRGKSAAPGLSGGGMQASLSLREAPSKLDESCRRGMPKPAAACLNRCRDVTHRWRLAQEFRGGTPPGKRQRDPRGGGTSKDPSEWLSTGAAKANNARLRTNSTHR